MTRKILLEISDELGEVLDAISPPRKRNPTIEALLWRLKEVRDKAKELGLPKPNPPKLGRPPKEKP